MNYSNDYKNDTSGQIKNSVSKPLETVIQLVVLWFIQSQLHSTIRLLIMSKLSRIDFYSEL